MKAFLVKLFAALALIAFMFFALIGHSHARPLAALGLEDGGTPQCSWE